MKSKKTKLPKPHWCSAEELAECWNISLSLVKRYTQTGQLHLRKLYECDYPEGTIRSWLPDICEPVDEEVYLLQGWHIVGLYYKQEEVDDFFREEALTEHYKSTTKDSIGPKERGTWLKVMYLLAEKLADTNTSAYKKKDNSFKVSHFETVLKEKMVDLFDDDDITGKTYGLSNDTLKKIFDEAEKNICKYLG